MNKITMDEIAAALGLSKSLVSLALSNKYGVNDETRAKIVLFAVQNGYDFNKCRFGKETSNKKKISVFIRQEDLMSDRFWPKILFGIEKSLSDLGIRMKVEIWEEKTADNELIIKIIDTASSGIIIISEMPPKILDRLVNINIPIVMVDSRSMFDSYFDTVRANNYSGGFISARYLTEKGHKNILFAGNYKYSFSFQERFYGFKDYLEMLNGNTVVLNKAISAGDNPDNFYTYNKQEVLSFFNSKNRHPTAIMCENDPIAILICDDLKSIGLKIPDDVSVMGFDNIEACDYYTPKLTSVNVPKQELGMVAVRMLMERIASPQKPVETISLNVEIKEKESVKDINNI